MDFRRCGIRRFGRRGHTAPGVEVAKDSSRSDFPFSEGEVVLLRVLNRRAAPCILGLWIVFSSATLGADPDRSSPPEANTRPGVLAADEPAPAEKLSAGQQQIADDFQHLQDVLLRMAELSATTDPDRAALLRKAVRQSEEHLIRVQFQSLVELLKEGRLSRAIENQDDLLQDLETLLELLLSEDRARRIRSEKERIRDYLKRLSQIIKLQKGIQGRTTAGGDPKPLAGQQEKLAGKTGQLAKDIKENEEPASGPARDGQSESEQQPGEEKGQPQGKGKPEGNQGEQGKGKAPSGSQEQKESDPQGDEPGPSQPKRQDQNENTGRRRIEAAQQRMREAQRKLEQAEREGAVEEQEEAIRELEQAKADLEEILRQLREEEIERMLATLEARFVKMLRLQRDVYEGTLRLDKIPEPERTHDHEIEASRLSRKEAEIVLEADKALMLLREDGTAVAFPEALEQARQDMLQVGQRLDQAKVGQITQTIEEEIIAALEEMIEALKQAQQDAEQEKQQRPTLPGPPQDQPLVDLLAEIRMIRTLQMRVNRRTERYSKLVEGEQAENPDLLEALSRLAEQQQRIHQITRDLQSGKNR